METELPAKIDDFYISLNRLVGKTIVDVVGHISIEFGDPVFALSRIEFSDGTSLDAEGEHDLPYLVDYKGKMLPDDLLTKYYGNYE